MNFSVESARVGRITDYDKLILEVWTDGSISPTGSCHFSSRNSSRPFGYCLPSERGEPAPEEGGDEKVVDQSTSISKCNELEFRFATNA